MRIWIGNLKYGISGNKMEQRLLELFSPFGSVEDIEYRQDGYAFVEMSDWNHAENAIAHLDGKVIYERPMLVKKDRNSIEKGIFGHSVFCHRPDKSSSKTSFRRCRRE